MAKLGLQFLAASLRAALSGASYGITSICSGEFLPLTGQYTLKHEVAWSYYDNWFSDMYAEVYTEVDGAKTSQLSEEYVMGGGGGALHYLEKPTNGEYTVSGHLRTGYPKSWGFDGYFGVECPLWTGRIENEGATGDAAIDDGDSAGVLAVAPRNAAPMACDLSGEKQCVVPESTPDTPENVVAANPPLQDEARPEPTLSTAVTGVVQSVGPEVLVLITDSGQYVTLTLPAKLEITRHTYVNLDEIAPDSVVGAILGKSAKNETEVVHFRLYRNVSKEAALAKEPPITDRPGFEIRGVLKAIARGAQGKSMRLAHAKGEAALPVAADAFATIIDSAQLSELKPFSGRARAVAQPQDDGTLLVKLLEILQ